MHPTTYILHPASRRVAPTLLPTVSTSAQSPKPANTVLQVAAAFGGLAIIVLAMTQLLPPLLPRVRATYYAARSFHWRDAASFRVTPAMVVSISLSMLLGVLLGVGVGLVSGLEPAVVIGVSASMAMGCVFVMSFAILHGVDVLRAVSFAMFVTLCLPVGFGVGFGIGVLGGVFLGLERADDVRDKTREFVGHFGEFLRVVAAFSLEIL